MTPAGIEPATFRFVAQHLNHCATAVCCTKKHWLSLYPFQLCLVHGLLMSGNLNASSDDPKHLWKWKDNYTMSSNVVTNWFIIYLVVLRCPELLHKGVFCVCVYIYIYIWLWHRNFNTSPIGFTQIINCTLPSQKGYCPFASVRGSCQHRSQFFSSTWIFSPLSWFPIGCLFISLFPNSS